MNLCSTTVRRMILEQAKRANTGHIASALSVADILAVLYSSVLRIEGPTDPQRDRFILSKGHAGLALYVVLFLRGWIGRETLESYMCDGSLLGVHPEHEVPGVEFSTGSLGLGLSVASGLALAARLQGRTHRVFVLLSDAECDEGSTWEAALFAGHHGLSNLVGIIDYNGQQALGRTEEVLALSPMADKWRAFGWQVEEVDGHDRSDLVTALTARGGQRPMVVIARTVAGKGVSFMENRVEWHYWPLSDDELRQAHSELDVP